MKTIVVKHNQTLKDIAVKEYGDLMGVFAIVEDNDKIYSPSDTIKAGDKLLIRNDPNNKPLKEYLADHEIVSGGNDTRPEGVGFWIIEDDFIVQ